MVKLLLFSALIAAIIIAIGLSIWVRRAATPALVVAPTEATATNADNYYVNVESIRKVLPTGVAMPPKLEKFLQSVAT